MNSPLLTSICLILGFFAVSVLSQNDVNPGSKPPPPPPFLPPFSLPPPYAQLRPPPFSPPTPPRHAQLPTPSTSPPPTLLYRPPPPSHTRRPPPSRKYGPHPPKLVLSPSNEVDETQNGHYRLANRKLSPPSKQAKLNLGEKIGLTFAGIVVLLQVIVIAFLAIKRRQLLKPENGFQRNQTEFVAFD